MTTEFPTFTGSRRGPLRTILEHVLVQESRLAAAARDYAWHVRGSPLQSFKRLVAEQGRQIDRWVGELAECLRAFGVAAAAFQGEARGDGAPALAAPPRDVVAELLARHEAIVKDLGAAADEARERDPDGKAALILSGLIEFHETSAWMLRLLLNSPERARVI